MPFIWVPAADASIKRNGDKLYCGDHFSVRSITYNGDREIVGLTISNDSNKGQIVYAMKEKAEKLGKNADALSDTQLKSLEKELQRTGVGMEAVKERYQIEDPAGMGKELYRKVMQALAKTKSAEAA